MLFAWLISQHATLEGSSSLGNLLGCSLRSRVDNPMVLSTEGLTLTPLLLYSTASGFICVVWLPQFSSLQLKRSFAAQRSFLLVRSSSDGGLCWARSNQHPATSASSLFWIVSSRYQPLFKGTQTGDSSHSIHCAGDSYFHWLTHPYEDEFGGLSTSRR